MRREAHDSGRSRYDVVLMDAVADDFAPAPLNAMVRPAESLPIAKAITVAVRKRAPVEELPDA